MKNYLPRLRTRGDVVSFIKATDKDSAISEYLLEVLTKQNAIKSNIVGNKVLVNLDECLLFFTSNKEKI